MERMSTKVVPPRHLRSFKTVLICGGSGFIGSNFVRHYYHAHPDARVVNLDLLTYAGSPENLADIDRLEASQKSSMRRYRFVKGDICDASLLDRIFTKHKPDLIVNFAAESHVDRSIVSYFDFVRTNIEGVRSLLEASRAHQVGRFIQISTDEVYGDVARGGATEEAPFRPSNPYAASKAGADLLVQSYIRTHRAPAIIIRGSNNYGPYQYPEKLIPLAVTNMLEGRKIPIHGGGRHIRSWLHVLDFCSAINLIAHNASDNSIYNVSGEQKRNIEVLAMFAHHLGKDLSASKEHIGDRPGADMRYAPDSSKLKRELGWRPTHTLAGSIGDIATWYATNTSWWHKIKRTKKFMDHYKRQSRAAWH